MPEIFDFVIVGGGTAGCVLANRLSENPDNRVLLLEAGGNGRGFWVDIPAGFTRLLTNPEYNWLFTSEPEERTGNRTISIPRGRGLGGSTLINGMIYVRGQRRDFDGWAQKGATGWDFESLQPYFKKLERYAGEASENRGVNGPFPVTPVTERPQLADAFVNSALNAGYAANPDHNSGQQEGFGYYQVNQSGGRRVSTEAAYLRPVRGRPNLEVRTRAMVTRILFDKQNATGVEYIFRNKKTVTAKATREVILTAGAVQSPQLLELSGIGDPKLLAEHDIPVVSALRGVGENYQDHYCTRMNWRVNQPITLNEQTRGIRLASQVAKYFLTRKGILTLATGLACGFVKTRPDLEDADIQYFFMHASYADAAKRLLDTEPGMTIGVSQLRPDSVGSIHIKSTDPQIPPAIRPNFLTTRNDLETMRRGMEIARDIVAQAPLSGYIDHELSPGSDVQTADDWDRFTRSTGQTIYHICGTAKIGPDHDPLAVVDPDLKVRGVNRLRVVDASVMPTIVSGNSQAAVLAIAERGADLILTPEKSGAY